MSHPYLPAVIALVQRAGQATLPHWRNDVAVTEKVDASPVTAADLAAHEILAAGLRELSALSMHPQFTEGRALAALYLTRDLLIQRGRLEL